MIVKLGDIENAIAPLGLTVHSIRTAGPLCNSEPEEIEVSCYAAAPRKPKNKLVPKRILKNGDYMTVLWEDGAKTIVKRAPDEPESDYAAFTAAIGIRVFGSNSALKRIVESAEVHGKKKKKKKEEPTKAANAFDKAADSFCKSAAALIEEMAKIREDEYEQQKTDEWLDSIEAKQNDNRS